MTEDLGQDPQYNNTSGTNDNSSSSINNNNGSNNTDDLREREISLARSTSKIYKSFKSLLLSSDEGHGSNPLLLPILGALSALPQGGGAYDDDGGDDDDDDNNNDDVHTSSSSGVGVNPGGFLGLALDALPLLPRADLPAVLKFVLSSCRPATGNHPGVVGGGASRKGGRKGRKRARGNVGGVGVGVGSGSGSGSPSATTTAGSSSRMSYVCRSLRTAFRSMESSDPIATPLVVYVPLVSDGALAGGIRGRGGWGRGC